MQAGLNASRIKTISYGKEKPFCTESNESCWQQNRRGHFVYAEIVIQSLDRRLLGDSSSTASRYILSDLRLRAVVFGRAFSRQGASPRPHSLVYTEVPRNPEVTRACLASPPQSVCGTPLPVRVSLWDTESIQTGRTYENTANFPSHVSNSCPYGRPVAGRCPGLRRKQGDHSAPDSGATVAGADDDCARPSTSAWA